MKRNEELDKLFDEFVNDLMLLVKESKAISSDKNKWGCCLAQNHLKIDERTRKSRAKFGI